MTQTTSLFDQTASAKRDTSAFRLLKLILRNFKGIREFTLDAGGRNVAVSGDNATGKTTLFDAFTWLLFSKDSTGAADFAIKPLDAEGLPIHNLETSVEGVFEIGGKTTTFRKVFSEKWSKKRGSAKSEFVGHETNHFIDGVPVQAKEYAAQVAEIAREDVFKLLTSPTFFNENLHWQERRRILLEVCGDLTDQEVIAADEKLAKLPEILNGRRLDDHRKVIAARRAEINKELERIPVRIDEAQRALPNVSDIIEGKLSEDIERLKATQQQKREELARLESGGEVAEKRKQLAGVEYDLIQFKNHYQADVDGKIRQKQLKLNEIKGRILDLKTEIDGAKRRMTGMLAEKERLEAKLQQKRESWFEVNDLQFEFSVEPVCPTCGQNLPEERLVEAREKALADFNRVKAERLEQISADGKAIAAELERLMAEHSALAAKVNEAEQRLSAEEGEAARIQAEVDALAAQSRPITDDPAYQQKFKEKEQLEVAISQLQIGNQEAIADVRREINSYGQAIEALEKTRLKLEQHKQGQVRIEELKAQEKALAAEFEKLEGELFLTEEFIRSKVRLLEERINSRFKLARFKLFDVQVNGGVVECCETTYNGVPYGGGLNNGARINVGLDIINTLSEHYGFAAPIWIDNREAITKLIETGSQVISLVVSEKDKKLRVEVE